MDLDHGSSEQIKSRKVIYSLLLRCVMRGKLVNIENSAWDKCSSYLSEFFGPLV